MSTKPEHQNYHVGESNYSHKKIQPWHVWLEYHLDPWEADIIKRILRTKDVPGMKPLDARIQDFEKVIHICQEKLWQLRTGQDAKFLGQTRPNQLPEHHQPPGEPDLGEGS